MPNKKIMPPAPFKTWEAHDKAFGFDRKMKPIVPKRNKLCKRCKAPIDNANRYWCGECHKIISDRERDEGMIGLLPISHKSVEEHIALILPRGNGEETT